MDASCHTFSAQDMTQHFNSRSRESFPTIAQGKGLWRHRIVAFYINLLEIPLSPPDWGPVLALEYRFWVIAELI